MSENPTDENNTTEIKELIRVRFWGNPRPHTFRTEGAQFRHRQMVVAESDRGMAVGMINSFPFQKKINPSQYAAIERQATDEDLQRFREKQDESKEIKIKAMDLVEELKLNMSISHVTPLEYKDKVVIYFTAPDRVDFRELLKKLAKEIKGQIELCQIDQQQKAEALGVIGSCGHTSGSYLTTSKKSGKQYISLKKAFTRF